VCVLLATMFSGAARAVDSQLIIHAAAINVIGTALKESLYIIVTGSNLDISVQVTSSNNYI